MRFLSAILLLGLMACGSSVAAQTAMVVSEQRIASQAGIDILRAGGNAIDAAVAVGYTLAVVNPCCGNLGGGGFMTIHLADGKNIFINFREKAPLRASKNMFIDAQGQLIKDATTQGYLAVAVPGTVLGLDSALQKYGTLQRAQVMAPAIRLAEQGYPVTAFDAKWFAVYTAQFRQQPNVAAIFLKNGKPYPANESLVQINLAKTLKLIAQQGPTAFYKGSIAHTIVKTSQANGGILSLEDFANYTVEELAPLSCDYRDFTIFSAPPPSSGGTTLCEILNILENFPLAKMGFRSPDSVLDIIEAMRYGFIDRNSKLGDPDFVTNPVAQLLSKTYAAILSKKIKSTYFAPVNTIPTTHHELTDTTHFSVVDGKGNAVAVTYTLNGFFGAKVIAGDTGFFLNDEMDDFAAQPGTANKFGLVQNEANAIQPGKRPLSSMAPTLVMKNAHLFMVLGSPGGPRIITSILLTLLNVIDYKMTLQQAINTPRFHFQALPDAVDMEPNVLPITAIKKLEARGYHFTPQTTWGAVEAILIDPSSGIVQGANDNRRPDGAAKTLTIQ